MLATTSWEMKWRWSWGRGGGSLELFCTTSDKLCPQRASWCSAPPHHSWDEWTTQRNDFFFLHNTAVKMMEKREKNIIHKYFCSFRFSLTYSQQIWRTHISCFRISNHLNTELLFRSTPSPPALPQSPVCPGQRPQVSHSPSRCCCCCGDRLHVNFYKKLWWKTEYNTGAKIRLWPSE